ncbi:MAG: hypothetical protein Q9166_007702 [cf. Caloplaca sp. 2 TL-2023]
MATTPLYMASRHDLEDAFNAMRPCFDDKESEHNFNLRDQAISKLRRITAGNAPIEVADAYATGIKSLLDGIIKVINSLRTTVSKNGCDLVQDMAKAKILNMDNVAEIILPHLIKLCASTKKISADKANDTVTVVIANISYNIYLMRLIWSACDDKNVQPRKFATGWLKTLVGKHRENKHVFEKGDGLSLFEKCLKKGLADSNPDVRQSMRPTYWAFIRLWPERSEGVLSALSAQHRKVLTSEPAETAPAPIKAAAASKSAPKPKQSIKDAIAAKRQAAKVEKTTVPQRKVSTSSSSSEKTTITKPKFSTSSSSNPRPAAVATTTRTLSSAPVRPARTMRKATATSKTLSPDLSKSAIEVSKASSPKPAAEANRPASAGSIAAMAAPAFSRQRSSSLGLSPSRELVSPPLITMLRERSRSPAAPVQTTSMASEVPIAMSIERPITAIYSRKEGLARRALQELDINEPVNRPVDDKPAHGEDVSREKWVKVERHQLSLSSPKEEPYLRPSSVDSLRNKMLTRINDIKCGTHRLSTYRQIQCIIRGGWPVLGHDPELFDELLFAIFDVIESWGADDLGMVRECGSDENTQVLLTLRVMLRYHNTLFSTYYPRALCALLSAARSQDDSTHMRFGLEDTVKAVINECDIGNLEDSIDSVLDYLESYTELHYRQPEHLGLLALIELMKASDPERLCRPEDQADRLGKLAAHAMRSTSSEMRQRACDFAMTYASFLADDERFWKITSDIGNDRARLLTYYFTKERTMQAFRVEEELLKHAFRA